MNVFKATIIALASAIILLSSGLANASAVSSGAGETTESQVEAQMRSLALPIWPAGDESMITSPYGWRIHPISGELKFHYGLDIGVDQGTPVISPLSGVIKSIEWRDAVGYSVEIDHGGGVFTRYCHLSEFKDKPGLNTYAGMTVAQGQLVALSGNTGYLTTGPHLHFEVYDFNDPANYGGTIDPLKWLASIEPISYSNTGFPLLYDYGGKARIWNMNSNGSAQPEITPVLAWWSGYGAFDASRCNILTGDFNADGFKDLAVLYDYGNATARIWTLMWNGSGYTDNEAWYSGPGNFDRKRAKISVCDSDGNGRDDIVVLYDYGNSTTRIWELKSNGSDNPSFSPRLAWSSGAGKCDAARVSMVTGDFYVNNAAQAALLYDYGNTTARLWTIGLNTTNPVPMMAWYSGSGFDAKRAKMTSGDYDEDNRSELGILYDYGNSAARIWTIGLETPNPVPKMAWYSGPGNCDSNRIKLVSGNFGSDSKDDMALFYDYGGSAAGIWLMLSNGSTMSSRMAWHSGFGNCDAARCYLN